MLHRPGAVGPDAFPPVPPVRQMDIGRDQIILCKMDDTLIKHKCPPLFMTNFLFLLYLNCSGVYFAGLKPSKPNGRRMFMFLAIF